MNLVTFASPPVVEHYAALNYLTPCEQLLFSTYLEPGMSILDLGVGGGRTTPYLSSIAGRYVGADYSPEMLAECRKKFPHLEFHTADAADLSVFASSSLDAVVMAFNVLDNLNPVESRQAALREAYRVLKPHGVLIFSSHNARSIFVRPSWNPQRIHMLAQVIAGNRRVFYQPVRSVLTGMRVGLALLQSLFKSIRRAARGLPRRVFWRGQGYLMDSAHGGLTTYFAIPRRIVQESAPIGFRLLRILGDDYPRVSRVYATDWYYYVFSKAEEVGRE